MHKLTALWPLTLLLVLTLLTGCGSSSVPNSALPTPAPLSADNINLIFVASEDLAYHAWGDVNPSTANLTNQGLQRSLLMATFLHQHVLGTKNVTGVYAVAPMTHLQAAGNYPDMAALETIQQFALLNQITLSSDLVGGTPYSGHSYPINASYASGSVPSGVAVPPQYCPNCPGLDFNDTGGDNEALVTGILKTHAPGFHVFSAPWETTSALLANINRLEAYNLTLPPSYKGPNYIYAISITPSGSASLVTYNSNLNPPSTYPVLPSSALAGSACTPPTPSSIVVTGGVDGAVIPVGSNTNQTLYMIRHAEAHPQGYWGDGNYVGAGQWRALNLPNALRGKISPNQVYSIDPAQVTLGTVSASGDSNWSNVAPSLTVEPYAIANNLPYHLVANFAISDLNSSQRTSDFFFKGGEFSNQKVLLTWQYAQNSQILNALLSSYFPKGGGPTAPVWSPYDYDSIWTLTFDAVGNLTADFTKCEGINSVSLPVAPPQF